MLGYKKFQKKKDWGPWISTKLGKNGDNYWFMGVNISIYNPRGKGCKSFI